MMENIKNDRFPSLSKYPLWKFIYTGINDGLFNMACDAYLLDKIIDENNNIPILRLYGWDKKTLSIGFNQSVNNDYDQSVLSKYPLVRRISGGQAVLHDDALDELTYSVFLYSANDFKKIYFEIGEILRFYLQEYFSLNTSFGYTKENYFKNFNCFDSKTCADIVVSDTKVIGSAQYRKKSAILQHGSIKLNLIRNLSDLGRDSSNAYQNLKECFQKILNINFVDFKLLDADYEKINKSKQLFEVISYSMK